MELLTYWRVLKRRWWLPVLMAVVVLALSWAQPRPARGYAASMRFLVGVRPEPVTPGAYGYDRYYTWLTSEYLIDDFSQVVSGSEFARRVSERLQHQGIEIPPGAIQGSTQTGKLHRLITITVYWGDKAELQDIANAVVETVREESATFFPQAFAYGVEAVLVDGPHVGPVLPGLREKLELPVRVMLAFLLGLGLVLLWHYVDDTLYEQEDVRALGLAIVGTVPRVRTRKWRREQRGQQR